MPRFQNDAIQIANAKLCGHWIGKLLQDIEDAVRIFQHELEVVQRRRTASDLFDQFRHQPLMMHQ